MIDWKVVGWWEVEHEPETGKYGQPDGLWAGLEIGNWVIEIQSLINCLGIQKASNPEAFKIHCQKTQNSEDSDSDGICFLII